MSALPGNPAAALSRARSSALAAGLRLTGLNRRLADPELVATLALVLSATLAGVALAHPSLTQVVLLAAALPIALGLALRSPRALILTLACWLVALGTLRRLLLGRGSTALFGDPLLLVEPVVLALLAAVAWGKGAGRDRSRLGQAVLVLCLLALIEAANPLQGGLKVGLGGLLFVLVPMLGFWVGRSICDDTTMRRLLVILALLALPAAAYGLAQTYVGFPSWDTRWIQTDGYAALNVGGVIRAFASFSSAAEYASFLGVGIAVWFAMARHPRALPVALPAVALLGTAVFLDSSRGVVVLAVVAIGVMAAALAGVRLVPAALCGLGALALLLLGASHLGGEAAGAGATGALVAHQVGGLAHPFNGQDSTLSLHLSELVSGLKGAVTAPWGHGTGSITLAASKFGGSVQGTEVDPSNAGQAFGLPGLVAYLVVAVLGLTRAYRVAARRRDFVAVALLGVLAVTFLQWLNGGQYAVAWLPWLALGWVDRAHAGLGATTSAQPAGASAGWTGPPLDGP